MRCHSDTIKDFFSRITSALVVCLFFFFFLLVFYCKIFLFLYIFFFFMIYVIVISRIIPSYFFLTISLSTISRFVSQRFLRHRSQNLFNSKDWFIYFPRPVSTLAVAEPTDYAFERLILILAAAFNERWRSWRNVSL